MPLTTVKKRCTHTRIFEIGLTVIKSDTYFRKTGGQPPGPAVLPGFNS